MWTAPNRVPHATGRHPHPFATMPNSHFFRAKGVHRALGGGPDHDTKPMARGQVGLVFRCIGPWASPRVHWFTASVNEAEPFFSGRPVKTADLFMRINIKTFNLMFVLDHQLVVC